VGLHRDGTGGARKEDRSQPFPFNVAHELVGPRPLFAPREQLFRSKRLQASAISVIDRPTFLCVRKHEVISRVIDQTGEMAFHEVPQDPTR
jgi:hypothetical protein